MNSTTKEESMTTRIPGIHHITAIASDAQANLDFYHGVLGQRLIKQTVNFDAPDVYHLYYGDDIGHPGTVMTFFPFPGATRGRVGAGQVAATAWSIPASSLDYWSTRLQDHGVSAEKSTRFGENVLSFVDPDGLPLELIGHDGDARSGWAGGPIPAEHALRGFHGATLLVREPGPTVELLTDVLGAAFVASEGQRSRYAFGDAAPGEFVDIVGDPTAPRGVGSAGTVHHIAWRTPDDATQIAWQHALMEQGRDVTNVRDRDYFHSIYFHEPGGILYEIATDAPGFAVDEEPARLGMALKLPRWIESRRRDIERSLSRLDVPVSNDPDAR